MNTTASAELEQRLADEAIASTSGRSSSRSFDARRASLQQDAKRGSLQVDLPPVPGAARLLEPVPEERRVTIVVDSVNAWVPNFVAPSSITRSVAGAVSKLRTRKRPQEPADQEVDEEQPAVEDKQPHKAAIDKEATATAPKKQILFDINVSCQPGEVLALMGPSGGGKTSLLSIMGGRTPSSVDTQGRTLYNGRELTKEKKRKVGFVLQDDLLHEALTVHETLTYAALLRLPKTMTRAQKAGRVNAVIAALGLGNCRDTIIGGFFRRGVSGGERKRVSVGHELLINPSVMLLDEPTSGLDSTTAMHLLQTLRELAQGGRAVVTTIHQPSSRLYQQLDSLLLLSMGHAMFYGEASAASGWFERLGCVLPRGVNTADFILDCASGQVAAPKREVGEDSRLYLVHESERYLREHPNGFRTTPRGRTLRALAQRSQLASPFLEGCRRHRLEARRLPVPGGPGADGGCSDDEHQQQVDNGSHHRQGRSP